MSRTVIDAKRSLQLYVGAFLPNDFDVLISKDEGKWERPSALITTIGPRALESQGPKIFDETRLFQILAWPKKDITNNDPKCSEFYADQIEEAFIEAFKIGGLLDGHPDRVPLWDWDGIGLYDPLPDPTKLDGYMRARSVDVDKRVDPDDDNAFTVFVNLRLTWRRLGEGKEELAGNTVTAVTTKPLYM